MGQKLNVSIYEGAGGGAGESLAMTSRTVRRMQEKYGVLYSWFAIESKRITKNFTDFHVDIAEVYVKAEAAYKSFGDKADEVTLKQLNQKFTDSEAYAKHLSKTFTDMNMDRISYRFTSDDWSEIRKVLGTKAQSLILTYGKDIIAILIGGQKNGSSKSEGRVEAEGIHTDKQKRNGEHAASKRGRGKAD